MTINIKFPIIKLIIYQSDNYCGSVTQSSSVCYCGLKKVGKGKAQKTLKETKKEGDTAI